MRNRIDHFLIGLLSGLLVPIIAFWLYASIYHNEVGMWDLLMVFKGRNVHTHVISLSVLSNLLVFFIGLSLQLEKFARGILGATIAYAILVFILKFI